MEDREIIELFWARDERAVEEASQKYGRYCQAIAGNILGNEQDAVECVNDTWLHAWNSIPPHRPENLKAFLGRLARCISLNRWRDGHSQKRGGGQIELAYEELSECIPDGGQADEAFREKELVQAIDRFLAALPETERRLFVRRYWYGDGIGDLAELLHTSKHTVSVRLSRMRKALKKHLIEKGVSL